MKSKTRILTCATMAMLAITVATATAVKKNMPDDDDVEKILKKLGGIHWQEDMDINEVGSVEVENPATGEEDYFNVFSGVAEERFRIIIFDNTPQYLGYYSSNYEPVDYEKGAVLLDAGDGESYFYVKLTADGPAENIRIDLTPTTFVKNEKAETQEQDAARIADQKGDPAPKDGSGKLQPEYREWVLESNGREYSFNAIFVRRDGTRIYLKESKRGRTNDFPLSAFSDEDRDYLEKLNEQ